MGSEVLGLLVVLAAVLTLALAAVMRAGRQFDQHVGDALDLAHDLDSLPLDERIRNGL